MDLSCRNRNETRPEYQYDMPTPPMEGVEFDDQHRPRPKARNKARKDNLPDVD